MLQLRNSPRLIILLITLLASPSLGLSQTEQMRSCIIASASSNGKYRTNVVTRCQVNTGNGTTQFIVNGKTKERIYSAKRPLTTAHLKAARRWLQKLRMDTRNNPAQFDIRAFLTQASQATSGFVLVRKIKGRTALNIVYITNGVYRSVDLKTTSLRARPQGLMTTGKRF